MIREANRYDKDEIISMMKDTKIANELKNVSLTDAKGMKTGVRTAEELASAITTFGCNFFASFM